MRSFWHPLSAVFLAEPLSLAAPGMLRMLLRAENDVALLYCGDRFWPSRRGPRAIRLRALAGPPVPGQVVAVDDEGIVDLTRLVGCDEERVLGVGDAVPGGPTSFSRGAVIGIVAGGDARSPSPIRRRLLRLACDGREAIVGRIDEGGSAETVRSKYDGQATFYARGAEAGLDPDLERRIDRLWPAGSRVVVAGSGGGREAIALARAGRRVTGVDFAPRMVAEARRAAARAGVEVELVEGSVEGHVEEPASVDGVLFTYDVYSFIEPASARIRALRSIRDWLVPGGSLLLSARRVAGAYDRLVLTLQWLSRPGRRSWGASHTRYIDASARVRRSYVRLFTDRALGREVAAAGLTAGAWQGGHLLLRRAGEESP